MRGKQGLIRAGLAAFRATHLHRLTPRHLRGRGAILAFHHVRPWRARDFAPNRSLEITPEYLDAVLRHLKATGRRIVPLDAVPDLLEQGDTGAPFVALTFDDGYRDNLQHALPVLDHHGAPFTLFVTTGFADRTARLWWIELEEALAEAETVEVDLGRGLRRLTLKGARAKQAAFSTIYWALRAGPDKRLLDTIGRLFSETRGHGASARLVAELCLDWDGVAAMATHPLTTIGCHTLSHPRLALHPATAAEGEMRHAKAALETRLGRPIRHLAYPVGDRFSAGARDFALARGCGFATAVTTRPGLLFPPHRQHLTALPRVSVNGLYQDTAFLDVLLSGAAFALWNRGRTLDVG